MNVINPFTEHEQQEKLRRDRSAAINIASIQMETLATQFIKRREISHNVFQRLVQSLLKIGRHIPTTQERGESFEAKMQKAISGDGKGTVTVTGNRVYIEGYYDLSKLRQEMLW